MDSCRIVSCCALHFTAGGGSDRSDGSDGSAVQCQCITPTVWNSSGAELDLILFAMHCAIQLYLFRKGIQTNRALICIHLEFTPNAEHNTTQY